MSKYLGISLFLGALIIGLLTFHKYGIGYDEGHQREIGMVTYNYIFKGEQTLDWFLNRDYGVAFELPLIILEVTLGLNDSREIYLARHLFTHVFFLLSAFCFFLLVDLLYGSKWLASAGFLIVVLCPVIYGHSFFNSKDVPFMAMFLISMYLTALALKTRRMLHILLLGAAIGLLINMRIMGVIMPLAISVIWLADALARYRTGEAVWKALRLWLIMMVSAMVVLYVSWPILWYDPFRNFGTAFSNMSQFRWYGPILFQGTRFSESDLPWTYPIVWFGITVPVLYIVSAIAGATALTMTLIRRPLGELKNLTTQACLIAAICFAAPLGAVIVLDSVLYDAWRQLYFIYAPFALLAVHGIHVLTRTVVTTNVITIVVITIIISFGTTTWHMIRNFPLAHVHFNILANRNSPEHLRYHYELDYWGVSFYQAHEYILSHDSSDTISVGFYFPPGEFNLRLLRPEQRSRIKVEYDMAQMDYFVTNYRFAPEGFPELAPKEWRTWKVFNNSVSTIYKLKDDAPEVP